MINIVLDIDGVMAKHMEMVKQKLNLPQIDGNDYGFPELSDEDRNRVFDFMRSESYAESCVPDPLVQDFFAKCKRMSIPVSVLTARDTCIADDTLEWVEEHFGVCDVVFESNKAQYLNDLNTLTGEKFVLIDDLSSNLEGLNLPNTGVVFLRPGQWYSFVEHGFESVSDWFLDDFLNKILVEQYGRCCHEST